MALQPQINHLQKTLDGEMAGGSNSGWNILRHELLYLLWALMELAIITPLFFAFAPWTRFWPPGLTVILLLLLMLLPFNLSRLMSTIDVPLDKQRIVLTAGLILTIIIAWRLLLYSPRSASDLGWIPEFFNHIEVPGNPFRIRDITIFLLVTFMWWRGISLIGRHVDISEIGLRMRLEVLLVFILVAGLAGSLLPWSVTPFVLFFFFASLLAIFVTRVEQLEVSRLGQSFPISFRWLIVVSGAATVIAFFTGAFAGALSKESINNAVGWFSPLWEALSHMGFVIVAIIGYLSSPLFILLNWLISLLSGVFNTAFGKGLEGIDLLNLTPFTEQLPEELVENPESAFQFPRQLLTILVMFFIVLFVTLFLGRLGRSLRRTSSSESQTTDPLLLSRSLPRPSFGQRLLDRLSTFQRWRAAASIRHLYRQMCATAADFGYPRTESETPYEYLLTLSQAWPGGLEETKLITEAYVRIHYGEFPENKEELMRISAAWRRLESHQPAKAEQENEVPSTHRREK